MSRSELPAAPRIAEPDMPAVLEDRERLSPHDDVLRSRATLSSATTNASHAALTECEIREGAIESLLLTGATLIDVEVGALRVPAISAREARLRRVRITGGRFGTLDLASAGLDEVELRGIRIDYLSLAAAKIEDLRVVDCTIGTLDMPQAQVLRAAFAGTRADEVDTRGMRADSLDLRGLDAASYLDVASLRGAVLTPWQIEQLAPAMAVSLGIHVRA
jgi:uncharacterized protein YjbI with pentapeptide repeats